MPILIIIVLLILFWLDPDVWDALQKWASKQ